MEDVLFGDVRVKRSKVAKLQVEGDLDALFVSTEYDDRDLLLTLTDCEHAWNGRLTHTQLSDLASKANVDRAEYVKMTLNALNGSTDTPFVCSVSLRGTALKLSWKKLLNDGVRFELGSMTLSQQNTVKDVQCSLLDFLVDQVSALQNEMGQLKDVNVRLDREHRNALSRLEANVQLKESIEKDLFGKFRLILNSKKAKIRHLLETRPEASAEGSGDNSPEHQLPSPQEEKREELAPSPKRAAPVKRRKRVTASRPSSVPEPPVIERRTRTPSEGEPMESDKLLELL